MNQIKQALQAIRDNVTNINGSFSYTVQLIDNLVASLDAPPYPKIAAIGGCVCGTCPDDCDECNQLKQGK